MLTPPVSDLTPWLPDHWITQTGYALTEEDITAGTKGKPAHCKDMLQAVVTAQEIIERVMQP